MAKEFSTEELNFMKTHKHYGEIGVEMKPTAYECISCEIKCAIGEYGGMYTEVDIFNKDSKNVRKGIEKGLRNEADCTAWTGENSLSDVSTIISFAGGNGYERLFSTMCVLTEESIQEIEAKITGKKSLKTKRAEKAATIKRYSKLEFLERIHIFIKGRKNERNTKERDMRKN